MYGQNYGQASNNEFSYKQEKEFYNMILKQKYKDKYEQQFNDVLSILKKPK